MAIVVHILTGLYTGGFKRFKRCLLSDGVAARHRYQVFSLTNAGTFGSKMLVSGVPEHYIGLAPGRPAPVELLRRRRIVREIRPDLIQGWMYQGNLAASVARIVAIGKPALLWNIRNSLHAIANDKPGTRVVIRAGKLLSRQPDCILYNSLVSRARHEAFGYDAPHGAVIPNSFDAAHGAVISNGFDTALWRPDELARQQMRGALGLGRGDNLVGFVGRYHPMKDIPNFLQAMVGLMATDPQVHCAIIDHDAGPKNPELAPYFNALPEKRVHDFGRRDEVAHLIAGFDMLCLSSKWGEAFPNVIGEALACNLPCVAMDVGDCRHIIGDTRRIVAASDPVELSQALGNLLGLTGDALIALGTAARARIAERFSIAIRFIVGRLLFTYLHADRITSGSIHYGK